MSPLANAENVNLSTTGLIEHEKPRLPFRTRKHTEEGDGLNRA